MLLSSHVLRAAVYFVIGLTVAEIYTKDQTNANIKNKASIEVKPTRSNTFYVVSVQIGSSTLNLSVDTGSSDLWVFPSTLSTNKTTGHNTYTPSTHAIPLDGYNFSSSYAEGTTVTGNVVQDYVSLGGLETYSQSIETASDIPASFVNETSRDGILGLGFGSINTVRPRPQKTFFEMVVEQLEQPVYAALLKDGAVGSLDFGFVDHAKYKGEELGYMSVDSSDGLWAIRLDGYRVGESPRRSFEVEKAAVDTGTSILMLPDEIVQDYYTEIPSAMNSSSMNGYIFNCDEEMPDFSIHIGDYTATIPSKFMKYSDVGMVDGRDKCYGSLQRQNTLAFSVLGHPFLKSQYVVFDMGKMRLGLGEQS
ncbi:aspartic proteinase complexed with Pepstatin [Talaromyces proteolyticus]|uniref:Aspartic proteinase complexed with Pepstatin n=1 Tax=Talaromyces proteolyticus TaxID=1131652 RepID=A0AAD4L652_9EURO|nr:aspartic proteinase complexed with Pepstatin [Talaromyces proteolyticus]KAH8705305.1 aspartic proteinase complexed with Pepstatin [Talaromyces proteolyticus]